MEKRILWLSGAGGMIAFCLASCCFFQTEEAIALAGQDKDAGIIFEQTEEATDKEGGVTISVVTTYAGEDSNAENYEEAITSWEKLTGNTVDDRSENSNELFKEKVKDEFAEGTQCDVVFFFTGADANSFIEANQVVPIAEIQELYPEYASNMDASIIPVSIVDGRAYAVPVNGYWEGLYYNSEVLNKVGVKAPGADYTIDQFFLDCEKILQAGYIPIATSLGEIPHYWWEYMIFNEQNPQTHDIIPQSAYDELGQEWVDGLTKIKEFYEAGFFPDNTLSVSNMDTIDLFISDQAAFLLDGSWRLGFIAASCKIEQDDMEVIDEEQLEKFGIAYFPENGESGDRITTDIIGGMSMGYYITRRAFEDPSLRNVVVSFVEYMTSDENVIKFAAHTTTALKNFYDSDESALNSLQVKAVNMIQGASSITPALQDLFQGDCRRSTFEGMPELVTGMRDIVDAVEEGLEIYYEEAL